MERTSHISQANSKNYSFQKFKLSLALKVIVNQTSGVLVLNPGIIASFFPMQNINLCQVHKMIIKTRSKSFINQDFKDVAADRCYFKLRWKCHIITITIYAVSGSTAIVRLREDLKIVALFEKGELAPCLQLLGEKPGEEFRW